MKSLVIEFIQDGVKQTTKAGKAWVLRSCRMKRSDTRCIDPLREKTQFLASCTLLQADIGFRINFTIDLKDNPFCDNLVLGFLLSEVKMNGRV